MNSNAANATKGEALRKVGDHLTRAPRSIRYRIALCDNRPEHHGRLGQSPWEAHSGGSFTRSRGATRDTALSEAITERLEQTRCFNGKFSG